MGTNPLVEITERPKNQEAGWGHMNSHFSWRRKKKGQSLPGTGNSFEKGSRVWVRKGVRKDHGGLPATRVVKKR